MEFLNNIREYKDLSELRDIVLSLIFLKHANDSFFSNKSDIISVPEISKWSYLKNKLEDYNFIKETLLVLFQNPIPILKEIG